MWAICQRNLAAMLKHCRLKVKLKVNELKINKVIKILIYYQNRNENTKNDIILKAHE